MSVGRVGTLTILLKDRIDVESRPSETRHVKVCESSGESARYLRKLAAT